MLKRSSSFPARNLFSITKLGSRFTSRTHRPKIIKTKTRTSARVLAAWVSMKKQKGKKTWDSRDGAQSVPSAAYIRGTDCGWRHHSFSDRRSRIYSTLSPTTTNHPICQDVSPPDHHQEACRAYGRILPLLTPQTGQPNQTISQQDLCAQPSSLPHPTSLPEPQ